METNNNSYFENMIPAEELEQLNYIPTIPEFVDWIEKKWADYPALSDGSITYSYAEICEHIGRKRAVNIPAQLPAPLQSGSCHACINGNCSNSDGLCRRASEAVQQ